MDDHVLFAQAISAALQDAGMGVCAAVISGRDAIAFLETDRADVVLMDLGLPDRSGLAVGQEILERWPEMKILAVTALDDPKGSMTLYGRGSAAISRRTRPWPGSSARSKPSSTGKWSRLIGSSQVVIVAGRPTISLSS